MRENLIFIRKMTVKEEDLKLQNGLRKKTK